ncbi:MAG: transcriptional regulator [Proteobacteria bacterium]|nr:MAG: transcriptional regulator [Pseudomonadota bacterium]
MDDIEQVKPILEQIADKWSIMVLSYICEKPQRFNAIKRRFDGITQKALTQTLRRLERNGLVKRTVLPLSPIAVEYSITTMGLTLRDPFHALLSWARDHQPKVKKAQNSFDVRMVREG